MGRHRQATRTLPTGRSRRESTNAVAGTWRRNRRRKTASGVIYATEGGTSVRTRAVNDVRCSGSISTRKRAWSIIGRWVPEAGWLPRHGPPSSEPLAAAAGRSPTPPPPGLRCRRQLAIRVEPPRRRPSRTDRPSMHRDAHPKGAGSVTSHSAMFGLGKGAGGRGVHQEDRGGRDAVARAPLQREFLWTGSSAGAGAACSRAGRPPVHRSRRREAVQSPIEGEPTLPTACARPARPP
jgi:hypothetical protein